MGKDDQEVIKEQTATNAQKVAKEQMATGTQEVTKGQMSKGSIYAIVAVLAVALVVSLVLQITRSHAAGDTFAVKVTQNGEVVAALPLDTDARQTFETQDGTNTVVVQDGTVHIEDADCAGGDCMKQGTISQSGQLLVCLPHKLIVEIVPAQRSAFQSPSVYTGTETVGGSDIDTVAR